jgi:hypothetical protein
MFYSTFASATAMYRVLRRVFVAGMLVACLLVVSATTAPTAQAAATPEAEAYDAGPIRQTRNPISGENLDGGVKPSALDQREKSPQPGDDSKGILETIKEAVTGTSVESPSAGLDTEQNPTLKRYTNVQK